MTKGSRILNPQHLDTPTFLLLVYYLVLCCGLTLLGGLQDLTAPCKSGPSDTRLRGGIY